MRRPGNLSIKSGDLAYTPFKRYASQTKISKNKKACFLSLGRFAVVTTTGPKMPKQALLL